LLAAATASPVLCANALMSGRSLPTFLELIGPREGRTNSVATLLLGLVLCFLLLPQLLTSAVLWIRASDPRMYLIPPFWFIGMYQVLIGQGGRVFPPLAAMALEALAAVAAVSVVAYRYDAGVARRYDAGADRGRGALGASGDCHFRFELCARAYGAGAGRPAGLQLCPWLPRHSKWLPLRRTSPPRLQLPDREA